MTDYHISLFAFHSRHAGGGGALETKKTYFMTCLYPDLFETYAYNHILRIDEKTFDTRKN